MRNTPQYSIGVDLGGTSLRAAVYSGGSTIAETIQMRTRLEAGPECVVLDICEAITELRYRSRNMGTMIGVGIGTPGPLRLPEGILCNPPNMPGWDGFNLRRALEEKLGFSVFIESDANVAALAEAELGEGVYSGARSLCVMTLGTGVGSGIILNGDIWHGNTGMGGEAGHIVVDPEGPLCGCGARGCLEQYASGPAIVRMATSASEERVTALDIARRALNGDEAALELFRRVGRSLAIGLTGLVNILNLPLYLLGGGVAEAWPLFAPTMLQELRQRSYVYRLTEPAEEGRGMLEAGKTYIRPARMGSNAGLLGACLMPLHARGEETVSPLPDSSGVRLC